MGLARFAKLCLRSDPLVLLRCRMRYVVEVEREEDGGWLAEVLEMPGAVAFGETRDEALRAAEALVLRTLADRVQQRELPAARLDISFVTLPA
jgi:predicted RNase H-like HicB family nuclease